MTNRYQPPAGDSARSGEDANHSILDQTPAPAEQRRTFSRRVLAGVGSGALAVGLLLGGGAGAAIASTVAPETSTVVTEESDSGSVPDMGTGTPPDMGSGTPPDMGSGTAPDSTDSGSTDSGSTDSSSTSS